MDYVVHLTIISAIWAILALSLNLIVGYTGLVSVAHAAFYGIGAYATAVLMLTFGFGFFAATGIGIVLAMVIALLMSIVLARFDGDIYMIASVAFGIIVHNIFLNWEDVTGGPFGIPGVPRPELFGERLLDNSQFLVITLLFLAGIYLLTHLITKSSFGRVLKSIREDEVAIQIFGYNTNWFKLAIFVMGAGMAAVAGSLYASYISFVDPIGFTVLEGAFILTVIVIGGLASNRGVVVGAIVFILLNELMRFIGLPDLIAGQARQLIYGVLLVLLMMYRPQGLFGEYKL